MLLRYVWGVGLLFFFLSAHTQESNVHAISFYYLADGTVQQGSVQVAFELEQAGTALSLPAIVDKDPSNLKLIAKITNLRWSKPDHASRFKLILGQDLNEVSENMQKGVEGNIYFRSTNTFKQMDYAFKGNSTELEPAMVMIGFLVADINATFEEAYGDDGSAGKSVGLGAFVKSFYVAPPYFEPADPSQIEMEAMFNNTLIKSLNDGFLNISFQMAEYLKNGDYSQFKTQLEEGPGIPAKASAPKYNVLRSSSEVRPMVDEETQLFQTAMASKRRSELNNYLNTYPDGRYTSAVRDKIAELTPFELAITQEEDGIYQKFIINITAGVSSRPPKISVSNNDDWAVQKDIIRADLIHIKVPPERMTDITLSLDSKDTTITLANAEVVAVTPAEPALSANTPTPTEADKLEYKNLEDEPDSERKANPLGAIILALPFLGYIYYLLHRKYHLG